MTRQLETPLNVHVNFNDYTEDVWCEFQNLMITIISLWHILVCQNSVIVVFIIAQNTENCIFENLNVSKWQSHPDLKTFKCIPRENIKFQIFDFRDLSDLCQLV